MRYVTVSITQRYSALYGECEIGVTPMEESP